MILELSFAVLLRNRDDWHFLTTTSELSLVSCCLGGNKSWPGAQKWPSPRQSFVTALLQLCLRLCSQERWCELEHIPRAVAKTVNWVVKCICKSIMLENLHLVRFYQQGAGTVPMAGQRDFSLQQSSWKRCWDAHSWILFLSFKPGSLFSLRKTTSLGFPSGHLCSIT